MARSRKDGNVAWVADDLSFPVAGDNALVLRRYYASFNDEAGPMGRGWRITPYEIRITDEKQNYTFTLQDGSTHMADAHYRVFLRQGNTELPYVLTGLDSQNNPVFTANESQMRIVYDPNADEYTLETPRSSTAGFDGKGRLTRVTDANHVTVNYLYDAPEVGGNLARIEHQSGRAIDLFYQGDLLTQAVGPGTSIVTYSYDARGLLQEVHGACCNIVRFDYDPEMRLSRITDGRGNVQFSADYDDYNRAGRQQYGAMAVAEKVFDLENRVGETVDAKGVRSTSYYDQDYRLLTTVDTAGRQVDLTWDTPFGPASVTDPKGAATQYQYDGLGNVSAVTDAQLHQKSFVYDTASNLIYAENHQGRGIYNIYDASNRLVTSYTNASLDHATGSVSYDPNFVRQYQYDPVGNPVGAQVGAGADMLSTSTQYDINGLPITITDTSGKRTYFSYDERSRLVRKYDDVGELASIQYTMSDQVAQITTPTGAIRFEYDPVGNLIRKIDPRGNITHYTYNADNLLTQVTDPMGGMTSYFYDIHGKLTEVRLPNGTMRSVDYDNLDRPIREVLALANVTPDIDSMVVATER